MKLPVTPRIHLAFLNHETGQLFAGDLYVTPKPKVILDEEHIPTTIESLKKILAYPFEDVFCSHAGYVQDGRKALQRKLEYLLELQHTVLRLYNEGFSPNKLQTNYSQKNSRSLMFLSENGIQNISFILFYKAIT